MTVALVACGASVSQAAIRQDPPVTKDPAPKKEEMPPKTPDTTKPDASADPIAKIREFIASKNVDKNAKNWKTSVTIPPKQTFDSTKQYFWLLNTTEGPIKIKLMPEVAPMHVTSTIYLTELGFYDDIKFHRVINGFMAQGGDPLGVGSGGPAYKYAGEFSPRVKHDRPGLLSMANAGPNTDGSQFFLTFVPTPHLDGKHTIFGEIVEGMDNLKKLEKFGSQSGQTTKLLKIETAKIIVQ
jgi:cyclophilin family peptidyl-prolyl cis-trans isomerase